MRLARRQLPLTAGLLACVVSLTVLILYGRDAGVDLRALSSPGWPEYVPVASLLQAANVSRFDTAPGVNPYPWHFFLLKRWDKQVIVPGASGVQRGPLPGPESHELAAVLNTSLVELRLRTGDEAYSTADSLGGRYRLLPGAGVQYEVYYRSRDAVPGGFHTVRLARRLMPLVVQYSGRSGTQLINVVLPYYNRFTTLDRFVSRFTKLVLDGQQHLMLTVVRYTDGFPTMGEDEGKRDHDNVVKCINEANLKMGGGESRIRLVEKHAIFSRGAALMEGARAWDSRQDVILFLCDVDIAFGKSFLQRCRANTQPAQKAYFPVVFSSYNPDIVYSVIKKKPVPVLTNYDRKRLINRDLGYWIDFGFGMSCQYLSDFRRLSGDFLNITGWGLEDVRLYEQFQKSSVGIVRMPDPDLVHVYHKKQCSKYEVGRRFNSCLKSKALNEASRLEWGLWVYKNMGDTDDVREFLKIFQQAQVAGGG